jgi:3-oxoadipate enol-lactonase
MLRTGGAAIDYSVSGSGPDVVLLHAGIADRRMWNPQIPVLARTFRITAYDLRGFGKSPMVEGPFAHYRDLRALLDSLGVERAALVGASLGGSVAIDFALEHPERVSALILADPGLDGYRFEDPWIKGRWQESEAALDRGDFEEAARIETETWLAGPERTLEPRHEPLRALLREMLLASYPAAKGGGVEEGPDRASVERLTELRVPTLVLVGAHDVPDMKRIADLLAERIPGAARVTIADAAHLPSLEQPQEFNRVTLEFLGRVLAPR